MPDFGPIRAELHKLAYHPDICQFPDRAVAIGTMSEALNKLAARVHGRSNGAGGPTPERPY
jgi:hypothetical protein